jgi:hypothetical protein
LHFTRNLSILKTSKSMNCSSTFCNLDLCTSYTENTFNIAPARILWRYCAIAQELVKPYGPNQLPEHDKNCMYVNSINQGLHHPSFKFLVFGEKKFGSSQWAIRRMNFEFE